VSNRNHRASRLRGAAGFILSVATVGIQACSGDDGATEPVPTSTGTFSLTAASTPLPVLQGGGGESSIAIVRSGGFAGAVSLAVTGAPAGITATVTPSVTTGTATTLVVTTVAAAAAGRISLTITGTAVGRPDQTTTATVDIMPSPGGTGNVTLDFSGCPDARKPIWFAYQDGTAAWTHIIGAADVYRFDVASTKGGYAFVSRDQATAVTVSLATRAELTGSTISACDSPSVGSKRLTGTVTGLGAGDVAYVGMGGPNPDPDGGPIATSFTLDGIQDGNQDLIAYRSNRSALGTRERAIIRRDQNIPHDGTIGTIDFDAAESFAPATAAVTVTGGGSARFSHHMAYFAGDACSYYDLYDLYGQPDPGVNLVVHGIPAARQKATDFHGITVFDEGRVAFEAFHTLADRTIAAPPALPPLAVTAPPGGHKRIQVALTLPSEYQTSLQLWLFFPSAGASVTASFGWLGGSAATLALPDFSAATGWSQSFLPAPVASVNWLLMASGANREAAGGRCAENARLVTAYVSGKN
jgi:hypothetical protein